MGTNLNTAVQPTMDYTDFLNLPDSENIRYKNIIKQKILANPDILYLLNAAEEDYEPEDYFGKYVLPYYIVDSSNPEVHNYLCYETSFTEIPRYSEVYKNMQIIFYICINKRDAIHPQSGIARHDLISALLTRDINWSESFGMKCKLVQDKASTTDLNYATRTLIFELEAPNTLAKTDMETGISYFNNTDDDPDWW